MAEDEDYGVGRIRIVLDDADAVADSRDLGLRIQRALDRSTRAVGAQIRRNVQRGLNAAAVALRVTPDLRRFDAALLRELGSLQSLNIPIAPDLAGFVERIRALLAGEELQVRVVPDLDGFDARIRAHNPPDVTVNADVDTGRFTSALGALGGMAARVGRSIGGLLRISAVGIAAAGAATAVGGLAAALAPAAGIIAAYPALILGWQAALGTLRLALSGVSDAFQAALTGSAKEFTEALEDLSPAARAAATEVRALKPAFEELRSSAQEAFFAPLQGQILATARALNGPLRQGVESIAAGWGRAALGVLGYVQGAQGVSNVRSILGATGLAVDGLSQTTNKLTAGVLQMAAAISDRFGAELAGGISASGQRLGEFLQQAAQGGDAVRWVDQALTTFARLGDLLGNIGSIAAGVFRASEVAGGGLLGTLQQITRSTAEFVNSAQGQTALSNIFRTLAAVGAQLGPILAALVTQVGQIAPALLPLFQLGPVIVSVINGLGTAAQAALPHLGVTLQQVATAVLALTPALPPLAGAAAALARSAADLAVALAPAVTLLAQIIGPIVNYAAPILVAAAATYGLVRAIQAAMALFVALRAAWMAINAAFVATPIGATIVLVVGLITALYLLYQRFGLVRAIVDTAAAAIRDGFLAAVNFVIQLPSMVGGALSAFGSMVSQFFVGAWQSATAAVSAGITAVVGFFVALPGRVLAGLRALPGLLVDLFVNAVAAVGIAVLTGLAVVIIIFTQLPGRVMSALSSLGSRLLSAFTRAFTSARTATLAFLSSAASFFAQLPGRVAAAVAALPGRLRSAITSAGASGLAAARSFGSSAVSFFSSLPGRIGSALSSVGSRIASAFRNAIGSARRAVSSLISSVVTLFSSLPGRIVGVLGNIGSRIVSKIKAGLPGPVRAALPFADGGVVTSPVVGLVGEAGPEVIIPLTRPRRAVELAMRSGLLDILAKQGVTAKGGRTTNTTNSTQVTNVWNIQSRVSDPLVLSQHLYGQVARAAGV